MGFFFGSCRRMCYQIVSHNSDPAHNVHLEFVDLYRPENSVRLRI